MPILFETPFFINLKTKYYKPYTILKNIVQSIMDMKEKLLNTIKHKIIHITWDGNFHITKTNDLLKI